MEMRQVDHLDCPIGVVCKYFNKNAVVIQKSNFMCGRINHLEPVFESSDPRRREWIIKIKDGRILREVVEGVPANDSHILVLAQSSLRSPGDCFIQLYANNLIGKPAAQPPVNHSPFSAADVNQNIGLANFVFEDERQYGVVRIRYILNSQMRVRGFDGPPEKRPIFEIYARVME
jgi:hypothetical protein